MTNERDTEPVGHSLGLTRHDAAIHELAHLVCAIASRVEPRPHLVRLPLVPGADGTAGKVMWRALSNASPATAKDALGVATAILGGMAGVEHANGTLGRTATIEQHGAQEDARKLAAIYERFGIPEQHREQITHDAVRQSRDLAERYAAVVETFAPLLEDVIEFGPEEIDYVARAMRTDDDTRAELMQTFLTVLTEMNTKDDIERARAGRKPLTSGKQTPKPTSSNQRRVSMADLRAELERREQLAPARRPDRGRRGFPTGPFSRVVDIKTGAAV